MGYSPESDVSSQTIFLRDYKYLDTKRLSDYLATVMPTRLEDIAQKFMASKGSESGGGLASNAAGIGGIDWGRGDILEEEDVYERAIKIGAKQLFTELHTRLLVNDSIKIIPDNKPTGLYNLKARDMVEITSKFRPALDTLDTIGHLSKFLEGFGYFLEGFRYLDAGLREDVQDMLDSVRAIEGNVIPVVATRQSSKDEAENASIVFLAQAQLIVGGQVKNLEGHLAVCGKVQSKEESVNLLDLLSIDVEKLSDLHIRLRIAFDTTLSSASVERKSPDRERPSWLARLFGAEDPEVTRARESERRETLITEAKRAVEHWRAIDLETTKIPGPVLVLMPLAAYT